MDAAWVVWVEDGGGDGAGGLTVEAVAAEVAAPHRRWRHIGCYLLICTFLGFFLGSAIGALPGFYAFRTEPDRVILWMRFDQILAIMALSCGLATLAIFRWVLRDRRLFTAVLAALIGGSPWLTISMFTGEGDWFRIGGALVGLLAAGTLACGFAFYKRTVHGTVRGGEET